MRIRKLGTELNIVAEIDDLIMELTYIKNGNSASIEKLNKGIEIIELIISLSEKSTEKSTESKLGFNPFHNTQHYFSEEYNITEYKKELEIVKNKIKIFIKNPAEIKKSALLLFLPLKLIKKSDIEIIQELLLKISVPIWKEEVSILKPKQYKFIEL